ncbi:MAG: tRNA-dihydrouridine synthase family protein [Gammaproteobacteria bacterium]|nr:MAG: tRNA-dihydrouridine synthase family protein [Gammaproteobacteria bacterium]
MIKPLALKNKLFPTNLIQGPLAGVSTAPFRRLTWRYSQPAFSCTEMISCKTILHQSKQLLERFVKKDPQEGPVCFQLSSNHPLELAEATKRVTDYGADLIDLNCGCPVKKIRSKGAGSSLLSQPSKLSQLICAMKQNTSVPISIKIRVDGGSDEKYNQEIAKVVSDAGADFLIVHGRHWTEHYETPCRYDEIRFFVEQLTIPVIGNGDVACVDSLKKMLATGCAGVMIGRAGVGQPWLIKKLMADIKQEPFSIPSMKEIGLIFMEHATQLADLLGNEKFAILQMRKLAKYYGRGLKNRMEFCAAVNSCENLNQLKYIVETINEDKDYAIQQTRSSWHSP